MEKATMSFPMNRQGVRDLDSVEGNVLPISGGPASEAQDAVNVGTGERFLSALAGGGLTYFGLSRGTSLGLGLSLVGAALLYRAMTGHCDLYEAMGHSTADTDPTREIAYRV